MGSSLLNIALSGTVAARQALTVAGHNITNAGTDGYHRQEIRQSASVGDASGSGYFGRGVQVDNVVRTYSDILDNQVLSAQASLNYYKSYNDQISQVDNIVADTSTGLSPALQDLFKGVNEVVAYPAQTATRQSFLGQAESFATRMHTINQRFDELREGVNKQISYAVTEVNAYTKKIAELNQRILESPMMKQGQEPNDLLDQRDQVVAELNKRVKVETLRQSDGTYSLFFGNGQSLVVGTTAFQLATAASDEDPSRMDVHYLINNNQKVSMPQELITGGTLGGLLEFRSKSLDVAQNQLGQLAVVLSAKVNEQQWQGRDLDSNLGGNLFKDLTNTVYDTTLPSTVGGIPGGNYRFNTCNESGSTTPPSTPAAFAPRVVANGKNATQPPVMPSVGITDVSKLTAKDYKLSFDGTNWKMSDSDGSNITLTPTATPTGAPAGNYYTTSVGLTVKVPHTVVTPGVLATGDSFLIQPTRMAAANFALNVSDPKKIAAATAGTPLGVKVAAATTNNGTAKLGDADTTTTGVQSIQVKGTAPSASVDIVFTSATQFKVKINGSDYTGAGTPFTYTSGQYIHYDPSATPPITADGNDATAAATPNNSWTVNLSGTPQAGDKFSISKNDPQTDNTNMAAIAKLQTAGVINGLTTFQGAYSELVSRVGSVAREVQISNTAHEAILTQAQENQQAYSGVNLDEEAGNLMRYQQAYQASAKVMQAANTIFDSILAVIR